MALPDQGATMSRLRNAAAAIGDQARRLRGAEERMTRAVAEARELGFTDDDIARAVREACAGRPDRARGLEAWAERKGGRV